jgi:hypothetical protein
MHASDLEMRPQIRDGIKFEVGQDLQNKALVKKEPNGTVQVFQSSSPSSPRNQFHTWHSMILFLTHMWDTSMIPAYSS